MADRCTADLLKQHLPAPINDAHEETFLLFSSNRTSHDLGILDPAATEVELSIAGHDFKIKQSPGALRSERSGGTTGAVVWRSSVLLGQALSNSASNSNGKDGTALLSRIGVLHPSSTVLELGAGVAGILPVVLGSKIGQYIATDQKYTLKLLVENVSTNSSTSITSVGRGDLVCFPLDWENDDAPSTLRANGVEKVDLIIACDCVYNFALVEPLVATLRSICEQSRDAVCLIVQPLRQADVFQEWLEAMMRHFSVYRLDSRLFGADLGDQYTCHIAVLHEPVSKIGNPAAHPAA